MKLHKLEFSDVLICDELAERRDILYVQPVSRFDPCRFQESIASGYACEAEAILPAPHSEATPIEPSTSEAFLEQSAKSGRRPFVALYCFADERRALWDMEILSRANIADITRNIYIKQWYECLLHESLMNRWPTLEGLSYCGATAAPPRMPTTTINPRTGKCLGLHLDTWEFQSLDSRRLAKCRLSINIGDEDRYFIFSDVPADEYLDKSLQSKSFTDCFRWNFLARPIQFYRLRIPPGYAYVAPTDLLFHDGCSDACTGSTAQFAVRGFFQRAELCVA